MLLEPIDEHKKKREVRFATMDIEAYEWIKFLVAGFYDEETDHYRYYTDLKFYADDSYRHCEKHKIKNIFAHFGGKYDFNFLLQQYVFDDDYFVDCIIPRGSSILSFEVQRRDSKFKLIYRDSSALLPFGLANLGDAFKVSVLKDTMDFINMKLAWENYNYSDVIRRKTYFNPKKNKEVPMYTWVEDAKGDIIEYTDVTCNVTHNRLYTREDILLYLKKDCISLWQIINKFYQWPLVKKAGSAITTASQAIKIWRLYLKKPLVSITAKDQDEFIRNDCYFGGRTEVFRPMFDGKYNMAKNPMNFSKENLKIVRKQIKKKIYCYDVNSLYPTVMRDMDYGSKSLGFTSGKSEYMFHLEKKNIGFWNVTADIPDDLVMPPLPVNHTFKNRTRKLIFPTGRAVKGKWSTHEIEYAKTLGVKITHYGRGLVFENEGKIFKEFITDLYNIRLEAKERNDSVGDLNAKLIMNSCYGRLGLQTDRSNLVLDDGSPNLKPHSTIQSPSGEEARFMEREVKLDKAFTNVAIPAMVTSYARVLMHKLAMDIGPEHIYYMDTDSYFMDKKWESGKQLGELKLEYSADSSVFLLPKTYLVDGIEGESYKKKLTMKGFNNRKVQHFTKDDFQHALRGELDRLTIKQEPKFATLKTALRNGRFLMMNFDNDTKREIDKERELSHYNKTGKHKNIEKDTYAINKRSIKSVYDKRTVTNQGLLSKPIKLVNGQEEL